MLRGPGGELGTGVQRRGVGGQAGAVTLRGLLGLPGERCGVHVRGLGAGHRGVDVGSRQLREGELVDGDLGVQLSLAGVQGGAGGLGIGGGLIGGLLGLLGAWFCAAWAAALASSATLRAASAPLRVLCWSVATWLSELAWSR